MNFIDTHQHLIYRDQLGYGWTNGISALSQGDFTLQDYQGLTRGKGISATIFMEAAVDDADYMAEARLISGLISQPQTQMLGQIASCRPESDDGFDDWLDQAAGLNVVGYRRVLHTQPDDLSQSEAFRRNIRKIGAKGLPFDLCVLPRQLSLAAELAQAGPEQIFVLDHCGVPDIAGDAFADWAKAISAMARLPNVNVKLSGLPAYCAPGTCSVAVLKPWVDHVIDQFSPQRVLWGGDWPVVNLGCGLPAWIDMTRSLIADLSLAEKDRITQGTAKATYLPE